MKNGYLRNNEMKNIKLDAQLELIENIKKQVLELESRTIDGFDLAMDILSLLKNIKPTIK
jgi:hypothetical protein